MPGPHSAFVVQLGGVVADEVAPPGAPRLDPSTIGLLSALLTGDWLTADDADDRSRSQASGVVAAYTQFHLERGLRSLEHVDRQTDDRDRRPAHPSTEPAARRPGGSPMTEKTHPDAAPFVPIDWTGLYPPTLPKKAVPEHVAIVMDGNGRWANAKGLTRVEGHKAGEAALLDVVAGAIQIGVKHLSVYAFSTENWKRSPDEVRFLMGFNREVLHRRRDQLNDWGVRVRWAGRKPRLWASVINELQFAERLTAGNSTLTLTMCVNYGGRTEIADAVQRLATEVAAGRLKPAGITREDHREGALRAGPARRRPVRAELGGAAHQQLHAVAERVCGDGVPRHAVAGLRSAAAVGGGRRCTRRATVGSAARSTRRRRRRVACDIRAGRVDQ